MILALALILLAQADDFVRFDLCHVDMQASPHEKHIDPKGGRVLVRKSGVSAIISLPKDWVGIACVQLQDGEQRLFVVGTEDETRKLLER